MKYVFIALLSLSCAGYKMENRSNPLAPYDISSLAIPQFVNYSNVPGVAEILTKDFTFLFTGHRSLTVYIGEDPRADAILVGIVDGPKKRIETTQITSTRFIEDGVLKGRQGLEVPDSASYNLMVHIMIIKDGAVLLEKRMPFKGNYNIIGTQDSVSAVNLTKNQGIIKQSMAQASQSLAERFEALVLNAF